MPTTRPSKESLIGKDLSIVPKSVQRIFAAESKVDSVWIGPDDALKLRQEDLHAYELAHNIMKHLCIQAPLKHASGHPGGPLSAFTFCYGILRKRDSKKDAALRMSAGHLSLLGYGLQWLGGRGLDDKRLASPQAIIDSFRVADGLPGHVESGVGDIPFGFGPLGKGLSNAVGFALGWKMQNKNGIVDVMMGDGDSQEGQVMEAARVASKLGLDHLMLHADVNDIQLSDLPSKVAAADLASIFQAMGWAVIEVQNGNDPGQVEAALEYAQGLIGKGKPIFLCYYTTMGYGVKTMEDAANAGSAEYHGAPMKKELAETELQKIPSLDLLVKEYEPYRQLFIASHVPMDRTPLAPLLTCPRSITAEKGAARKDFGATHILNLMKTDERIIVLHGDLASSGGFDKVEKTFPNRIINCGAAEANMYMMAAGLRQAGLLPVTYTFAAFGTNEARANARLIDINARHTPCAVLHDCTHSGLSVGEDGETHQERNYLNIPFDNTQVWMPADSNQAAAMAERGLEHVAEGRQSVYVFSARSGHEQLKDPAGELIYQADYIFDGKADIVRGAGDFTDHATIIATGISVHDAVKAADRLWEEEKIRARVLNVGCIRPLDASAVIQAAMETMHLIVVEDHHSEGGLATQVADVIADFQLPCSLRRMGVNHYFPSASAEDLKFLAGLDDESILNTVLDEVRKEVTGGEDAFVTSVYALLGNARESRFHETAMPYIERLGDEKDYLEKLRGVWEQRTADADSLPTNQKLREMLGDVTFDMPL
ncbi:MAG: transketolase [Candidatus Peribacteria bacterium]|nr:transketolase [Candidatus Peribacteria bacterium]